MMCLVSCFISTLLLTIVLCKNCDSEWKDEVNYDVDADRVYYIGCIEEEWDYCPSGKNLVSGETITSSSNEAIWCLGNGINRIGPKYMKALYREYTDNCFSKQKPRSSADQHLGALGPNIRALTDEKIKIFYKNKCSISTSLHFHGLQYDKTSEGAPYDDKSYEGDKIAADGGKWIYSLHSRNTNVDKGTSSKMWLYHSHIDEPKDVSTGLFGAVIITKKGMETSKTNLMPKDIDREFTTFMVLYDENESRLNVKNLKKYLNKTPDEVPTDSEDEDYDFYEESNLMHAINGYLFGNLDSLQCICGEDVRWYTASFGNEGDGPHSPHWHGNIAVDTTGDNTDTINLIPGTTSTVTMHIDQIGHWLYHCHVHDHIEAGMMTTYTAVAGYKQSESDLNEMTQHSLFGFIYFIKGNGLEIVLILVVLVNVIWCYYNFRKQRKNKYEIIHGDGVQNEEADPIKI